MGNAKEAARTMALKTLNRLSSFTLSSPSRT
jgi:hypothetical protein